MKNRWICLLLCFALLLTPILSSCSSNENDAEENISSDASESAVTLSLYLVSEEPVSAATAAAISERVNAITNAKYKTKVVLKYFTKDEYRATLEKSIQNYEIAKGITPGELDEEEEKPAAAPQKDETEINEYGMSVIKYPELEDNQVDVIYLFGEDFYRDFVNRKWLYALDAELVSSAGKIAEYASSNLLSAIKESGVTYAIPNNNAIGSYTYLLLDKELMDATSFNGYVLKDTIDGFYHRDVYSCLFFFAGNSSTVAIDNDVIGSETDAYEFCQKLLAQYWGVDELMNLTDDFSVFGHAYEDGEEISRGKISLTWENLFANKTFAERYLKLQEMKFDGYFGDSGDKKALLRFAVGDANLLDEYNARLPGLSEKEYEDADYYAIPIANPVATSEDIYSNMFAVCRYTKNRSRSMQIITLLNTDVEFRNLIQYGVEGLHYKKLSDNQIQLMNSDYKMDLSATGNEFLAYLTPDQPANLWENGKVQNRDSSISPLLGFDLGIEASAKLVDYDLVAYLHRLDTALCAKLDACASYADAERLVGEIAKLLDPNDQSEAKDFVLLKDLIQTGVIAGDLDTLRTNLKNAYSTEQIPAASEELSPMDTPNSLYYAWASANGYLPVE
ncbi:MAG: hypothetical protein IJR88_05405 [Clostridia bacterium]|nr:hypothetical protein [Clostridia bacterium]